MKKSMWSAMLATLFVGVALSANASPQHPLGPTVDQTGAQIGEYHDDDGYWYIDLPSDGAPDSEEGEWGGGSDGTDENNDDFVPPIVSATR